MDFFLKEKEVFWKSGGTVMEWRGEIQIKLLGSKSYVEWYFAENNRSINV